MSFYIHCGSEDFKRYFPLNSASSFQVKLPKQIEGEQYEVALLKINFTNNRSIFSTDQDRIIKIVLNQESHNIVIPNQRFESIEEFITCISEHVSDYSETFTIKIEGGRVCINAMNAEIHLSRRIADILGLEENSFVYSVKYAKYAPSLDNLNRTIYICMDSLVPQLTGCGYRPFLNIMSPKNNDLHFENVFSPLYFTLQPHRLDSLHFQLLDSTGKLLDLPLSETQLFIHFRRL